MGCTLSSYRIHPEFNSRVSAVNKPVLLLSDVNMYQLSSGGSVTLRDDWSAVGRKNLRKAISRNLKDKQCDLKPLVMDSRIQREIAEVQALYKLVHKTMDQHTFGPAQIADEKRGFQYSLGSMKLILQKFGADSAIFVTGYDRVSDGWRKSKIDLTIADASGTILYYSVKGTINGKDLRDPGSAELMVRDLLSSFSKAEG